jgi:hypothetical protein
MLLEGLEMDARFKRENHAGEAGCEIMGCDPPSPARWIYDLNPAGRPPLHYHEVIELPVGNRGKRDVIEMGRLQRESGDAESERSRGFGDCLGCYPIPAGTADFAALCHPGFPAMMVKNHGQTRRTTFHGVQLQEYGYASASHRPNQQPHDCVGAFARPAQP